MKLYYALIVVGYGAVSGFSRSRRRTERGYQDIRNWYPNDTPLIATYVRDANGFMHCLN